MKSNTASALRRLRFTGIAAIAMAAVAGLYPLVHAADPAPTTMPAATDAPTTAPAVAAPAPSMDMLVRDFKKQYGYLQDVLGDPGTTLTDPAKRAQAAPRATRVLHKLVDICDQMIKAEPDDAQDAKDYRADFMWHLALFGESDATRALATEAASSDPETSLEGKRSLLMVSWLASSDDVDHQTALVDRVEKLARDNVKNGALTTQLFMMSRVGCSSTDLNTRLVGLVTDVMKNKVAEDFKQKLQADQKLASMEGQPLVITGKTPEGKDFSTADWKGKVILVDFWATWCGPCKEELPRVKKIYEDYHAKGLEILGVSNDQSADDLTKFIKDDGGMPWPQLFDADAAKNDQWNPITTGYGIKGIPTMFLIDKKGIVRTVTARESMETLIPQMLEEK
jgi:thiol-disulfide isomerase/thioredoxin